MKGKELENQMYRILDSTFEKVNKTQQVSGSGKSFSYKLEQEVPKIQTKEKTVSIYSFTVMIREMGHGERELQTFRFQKRKSMNNPAMHAHVISVMLAIFVEHALVQWDELGKMLNGDPEMQDIAKNA